jgi:hypothetical protein
MNQRLFAEYSTLSFSLNLPCKPRFYIHNTPIHIAAVENLRDTKAVGKMTIIGIVIVIIIIAGIAGYARANEGWDLVKELSDDRFMLRRID